MDHESFDKLARALGALGSRRAALGALIGTGLAGTLTAAEAAKHNRGKKRKSGRKSKGAADVSAQAADCLSPGPSSNMNGCNFEGQDFSGDDLSGSSMVNTIFRNADLIETNLSSSNMRGANFRGANLCGADLSSSTLKNADFRGFAPLGRQTNLAFADLSSSACGGLLTNQFTFICGTTWCDGSIRNDSCPGGVPSNLCCEACTGGEVCVDNECVAVCAAPPTATSCDCRVTFPGNDPVCLINVGMCANPGCTSDADCTGGTICAESFLCPGAGHCTPPCPFLDDCTCPLGDVKCGDPTAAARRTSGGEAEGKDLAR